MLIENRFFAQGKGINFDEESLEILREAQQDKTGIDSYALFGLTANGHANGLRGTFLNITDKFADRFIAWLEGHSPKATANERADYDGTAKTRCF
jgi:acyl-CoA-binding protein